MLFKKDKKALDDADAWVFRCHRLGLLLFFVALSLLSFCSRQDWQEKIDYANAQQIDSTQNWIQVLGGDVIIEQHQLQLELKLREKPPSNINVSIRVDGSLLTLSQDSISFSKIDWSAGKMITLTAKEDNDLLNHEAKLMFKAIGIDRPPFYYKVSIQDDDRQQIMFVKEKADGALVMENSLFAIESEKVKATLALTFEPAQQIIIILNERKKISDKAESESGPEPYSEAESEIKLTPNSFTFTKENYHQGISFFIDMLEDIDEQSETVTFDMVIEVDEHDCQDPRACQEIENQLQIVKQDKDIRPIIMSMPVEIMEGQSALIQLSLSNDPKALLEISLNSGNSDSTEIISISPETLTFNHENYSLPQAVTLQAMVDNDKVDNQIVINSQTSLGQISQWSLLILDYEGSRDKTLPRVIQSIPQRGEIEVALDAVMTIHFSEEMDQESITEENILLLHGKDSVSVTLEYQDKKLIVKPIADLLLDSSYALTVSNSLKDLAGNSMADDYSLYFSTIRPLILMYSNPQPNSLGAALDTLIVTTFNHDLDTKVMPEKTIHLFDPNQQIHGTVAIQGNTLKFSPEQVLRPDTVYDVVLMSDIVDIYNNNFIQQQYSFRTQIYADNFSSLVNYQVEIFVNERPEESSPWNLYSNALYSMGGYYGDSGGDQKSLANSIFRRTDNYSLEKLPIEIEFRFQYGYGGSIMRSVLGLSVILCSQGLDADQDGTGLQIFRSSDANKAELRIIKKGAIETSKDYLLEPNSWYNIVMRLEINSVSLKIWADGQITASDWFLESQTSFADDGPYLNFYSYHSNYGSPSWGSHNWIYVDDLTVR